uniref:Uncharacterized protein n=1 Tax=Arundo donax TaxID=35708 RepID=A0A0A9B4A9_ARUDO
MTLHSRHSTSNSTFVFFCSTIDFIQELFSTPNYECALLKGTQ